MDNLTHGRVILGVGAGEAMNTLPYGLPWEDADTRVARLEETIRIIRMLWKSDIRSPVNFKGRFHHLQGARLDAHPYADRRLPIYIASLGSKRCLRLAGKVVDGWLPWLNTLESFVERVGVIDKSAAEADRSQDEIEKAAIVYLALTTDRDKQKRILDSMKAEIVVLMGARRLGRLGYLIDTAGSRDYIYQRSLASEDDAERAVRLGSAMPDSVAEKFLVKGTPKQCVDRMEELVEAGARHLISRNMLWANQMEDFHATLKTIGKEIIPVFS